MSFLDHLEELRWHLIRSSVVIVLLAIAAFIFIQFLVEDIILAPYSADFITHQWICKLQPGNCFEGLGSFLALRPSEKFLKAISISVSTAFVVGFPYFSWEIWRFVKPGLSKKERRKTRGVVFWVSLLFFMGVLFGYYIITPFAISFFYSFELASGIQDTWQIGESVKLVLQISLAAGIMFQLPAAIYLLSKLGIVGPKILKKYRRHAYVVLLILSAIITPPDIFSQILIFIPLALLYEISISISRSIEKKQKI